MPAWTTVAKAIDEDRTIYAGREFMSPRWVPWWNRPGLITSVFEYEDGTVAVPGRDPMSVSDFNVWEMRREVDGKLRKMEERIRRMELMFLQAVAQDHR